MNDDDEMPRQVVVHFGAELILRVAQDACVIAGHGLETRESGLSKRSLETCWEILSVIYIGRVMIGCIAAQTYGNVNWDYILMLWRKCSDQHCLLPTSKVLSQ